MEDILFSLQPNSCFFDIRQNDASLEQFMLWNFMQVWQLQEPFCNDYWPVWTLLWDQKIYPFGTNEKWFLWTMAASQAAENDGDEWSLTWYFLWGIYTWILTWTYSQNSLAATQAPSLKICSHGTSLKMITKTVLISTRIVISYAIKWDITL